MAPPNPPLSQLPAPLSHETALRQFEVMELYDVEDDNWVLKFQRQRNVAWRRVRSGVFGVGLWLGLSWHLFSLSRLLAHLTPPWLKAEVVGWLVMTALLAVDARRLYDLWLAWSSDTWIVDSKNGHFERNGLLLRTSYVQSVRVWQQASLSGHKTRLALELSYNQSMLIGEDSAWAEMVDLGQRISDYAGVPLKLEPLL